MTLFADASMRALAAAVRDPKLLTSPDVHPVELDLSRLQPSLRAVAPELGAVAPVVQLRDTLDLTLTLELPEPDSDGWPLRAVPADPALLRRAAHIYPPLGRMAEGFVELDLAAVSELRLAASALEFSGVKLVLPSEISDPVDLTIEDAELRLVDGPLSLTGTVQFDLSASLGGKQISREEFRELARSSQPLVRLGGEWRALSGKSLLRAKSMAAVALHGSSLPALTALGAALGGASDLRGLGVSVAAPVGSELEQLAQQLSSTRAARPGCGRRGLPRHPASLSERRPGLAPAHAPARPGSAAGRRHGTGQDRTADRLPGRSLRSGGRGGADRRSDLGAGQLGTRGSPVCSRSRCAHPSRPRPHLQAWRISPGTTWS